MNNQRCPCGGTIESTSCNPWIQAEYDTNGRILSGTCIHGINIKFEVENNKDKVTIRFDTKESKVKGFYLLMLNGNVKCLPNDIYEIDREQINILIDNDIPFIFLSEKRKQYFPFLEP